MQKLLILTLILTTIKTCQFSDPHCLSCNLKEDEQCDICIKSYPHEGKCLHPQLSLITNCFKYSKNQICSECQFGYFLQNNECKSIPINSCLIAESLNYCRVCDNGKRNDFLTGNCTNKKCENSNCKFCEMIEENEEYCVMCGNGFSLNTLGVCEVQQVDNCWVFGEGKCDVCNYGYFMKENNCLKSNSYSWEYSFEFLYLFKGFLFAVLLI